jgi:hypothetical protein
MQDLGRTPQQIQDTVTDLGSSIAGGNLITRGHRFLSGGIGLTDDGGFIALND